MALRQQAAPPTATGADDGDGHDPVPPRALRRVPPVAVVAAGLVGAAAPALRVAGHGPAGARGAVELVSGALVLAAVLSLAPWSRRWVASTAAAVALTVELLTAPDVGRLPALVTVLGVVTAAAVLGVDGAPGPRPGRQGPALVLLVAGSAGWWWLGSPVAALLVLLAAVAAVATGRRPAEGGMRPARPVSTAPWTAWAGRHPEAVAAVVAGGAAMPLSWRLSSDPTVVVRGVNDFELHWERVAALSLSPFRFSVPHPGFHVPARLVGLVLPPAATMTLFMVLSIAATAAVLTRTARSSRPGSGPLRTPASIGYGLLGVLMASPVVLLPTGPSFWQRTEGFEVVGRGAGFLPLHIWGSPTITMGMPMYLALVMSFLALEDRPDDRRRRAAVVGLCTAATLTMPAGTLGLAPALGLLVLVRRAGGTGGRWARVRTAAWLVVPGAAVVVWQMWFLATSQSPLEETTWRWSPLWMVDRFELDRPTYWLLLVVPAAAWAAAGRRFWQDRAVRWAGTAVGVAAFPALLLQETGWKSTHGGLALSIFMCLTVFTLFSLRVLVVCWQTRREAAPEEWPGLRLVVGAAAVALCATAGVVDLAVASGLALPV